MTEVLYMSPGSECNVVGGIGCMWLPTVAVRLWACVPALAAGHRCGGLAASGGLASLLCVGGGAS
jgi:hypothetical protein